MRQRWYHWRRLFRASRPVRSLSRILVLALVICGVWGMRSYVTKGLHSLFEEYGVLTAERIIEAWILPESERIKHGNRYGKTEVLSYLESTNIQLETSEDPAYERLLASEWQKWKDEEKRTQETQSELSPEELELKLEEENRLETKTADIEKEAIATRPSGSYMIREKLADYDYMIQNFYSIHPTTTAGRDMMDAETFLSMDLSMEKREDGPQILIYHTHSQEEFVDYPENSEATIVGVGAYLAKLLEANGYQVIHDDSMYDMKNGKLDRNKAYTYALEGISGILQKYPTIEVVLDLHRDGVDEGTKLVTDVNGKPTARIMFFNGTSQTPDGPIEYLPNPNRTANMAFSFQMHLIAAEQYPGLTRKIYLKGLRYNQHVRARTALVEVGAQTNTYAEALNAMEPLADLICRVLEGN